MPPPKKKPDEYARFEWEELERDAERAWYDDDEQQYMNEKENFFLGDNDKFK